MSPNVLIIQFPYYKHFVNLISHPYSTTTTIGSSGAVFAGIFHPLKQIQNIVLSILLLVYYTSLTYKGIC